MRTLPSFRVLAPAILLGIMSFRPAAPPAAANTFGVKVNGKALTGKPGYNTCILMMNAFTIGGNLADGSYIMLEIQPAAFPKLPVTLPATGGSLEKYAKIFYYPKGLKDALNLYTSVGSSGSITVTGYDAAARTITGTFSGRLARSSSKNTAGPEAFQVTDGRFDVAFAKM